MSSRRAAAIRVWEERNQLNAEAAALAAEEDEDDSGCSSGVDHIPTGGHDDQGDAGWSLVNQDDFSLVQHAHLSISPMPHPLPFIWTD
jgi:hypothetical protein